MKTKQQTFHGTHHGSGGGDDEIEGGVLISSFSSSTASAVANQTTISTTTTCVTTTTATSSPKSTTKATSNARSSTIASPGKFDVLCGRGGHGTHHPGNQYFRALVRSHKKAYQLLTEKSEKRNLAKHVVTTIQGHGGRFLEKTGSPKDGGNNNASSQQLWCEVGENKAINKASQALRELKQWKTRHTDTWFSAIDSEFDSQLWTPRSRGSLGGPSPSAKDNKGGRLEKNNANADADADTKQPVVITEPFVMFGPHGPYSIPCNWEWKLFGSDEMQTGPNDQWIPYEAPSSPSWQEAEPPRQSPPPPPHQQQQQTFLHALDRDLSPSSVHYQLAVPRTSSRGSRPSKHL